MSLLAGVVIVGAKSDSQKILTFCCLNFMCLFAALARLMWDEIKPSAWL